MVQSVAAAVGTVGEDAVPVVPVGKVNGVEAAGSGLPVLVVLAQLASTIMSSNRLVLSHVASAFAGVLPLAIRLYIGRALAVLL